MSNIRYKLYLDNTKQLVKTLVVKSIETVDMLNKYLQLYYGADAVDALEPSSWKYYLNVSGEYHPLDTVMEVVSWDTLETIVFNKANLEIHRATYRAYAFGTPLYKELLSKYPEQELLIKGILFPVDIETAINADDGIILAYDTSLVDSNEYSLIHNLNGWIKNFKFRWVNHQFEISDSLYSATMLGIMYVNLIPAILNFRLEACKTNEAHRYHTTEYLLSHGIPEICIQHLTKQQTLYFYRNIKYLQRHAGTKETFERLLDHIMTERGLPLSKYVMKHQDVDQLETLYPKIEFKNIALNGMYSENIDDYFSLPEILSKESKNALGNVEYADIHSDSILEKFEISRSSVVQTKMLECAVVDYTDAGQDRIEEVLINHWLYYSVSGLYSVYIGIINPVTGERMPLQVKDAFILAMYAFAKTFELELINVPQAVASKVQRIQPPSIEELMSVVNREYVSEAVAIEALSHSPLVGTAITSTEAFNRLVIDVHSAILAHRKMPIRYEHQHTRAYVKLLTGRIYADVLCDLASANTSYVGWFQEKNLDFSNFTRTDWHNLYTTVVKEATGLDLAKEPNLASIQAAMVKLFQVLTSYSHQFVTEINSGGIIDAGHASLRLGDIGGKTSGIVNVVDTVIGLEDWTCFSSAAEEMDLNPVRLIKVNKILQPHTVDIPIGIGLEISKKPTERTYYLETARSRVMSIEVNVL